MVVHIDSRMMCLLAMRCGASLKTNSSLLNPAHHCQYSITRTIRTITSSTHQATNCNLHQPKRTYSRSPDRLWQISDPQQNPLAFLNQFTMEPVLPNDDQLFEPNSADIHAGRKLFVEASRNKQIQTMKGVVDLKDLPLTEYPEVAFLGRSNVGKSSLIKAIFNTPTVKVSVSRKPGHTRVLKFYKVGVKGAAFYLVDMPGYGYNMPAYFVESMEEYLKTRKQLAKVFLLIDGDVGLQPADETAIAMLEEFSKAYVIIMTKIDKAPPSRILNHVLELRKRLDRKMMCCFPQPFLVSSTKRWGVPMLQSFITYITGAITLSSIS